MIQEKIFTDLTTLIGGGFQAARGVGEGWVDVPYETETMQGRGLAAGYISGAPPLVLNLGLTGVHTLYLGLGGETALQVWLDGENGYHEFVTFHGGNGLQDCRLHTADLTGRRLHIAMKNGVNPKPAHIGYIRAVPDEYSASARNLIATNDGWSWVALDGIESERDVYKFFAPFRDSDFFRILWNPAGADFSGCHQTRVGTLAPLQTTHAFRDCDYHHAQSLRPFIESGGDILKAAVEGARDVGIEIHFYIRPGAFGAPFPWEETFKSQFMAENPEWRCRDEHGEEIMRMSYAFAEVQDHMLEYFKELIEYSPDGICLAFNRSLPMMICEQPVLEEFEKQQGRAPNLPDEIDSEVMIAARTALMTQFIERVHALTSARRLALSCIVLPDEEYNRVHGLDLHALAKRGLFESISVHNGGLHAAQTPIHQSPFWKKLRDKKRTKIYVNGWSGTYDHVEMAQYLKEKVWEPSFDGGFFWDTENFSANPYNWHVLRRGGTREYLDGVINGEIPSPQIQPFTRIRGVKLGRYNPANSY